MIEFSRYARLKPQGLVTVVADGDGLFIDFARFDNENGKRIEPERCRVAGADLSAKLAEMERDLSVIRELLTFIPK